MCLFEAVFRSRLIVQLSLWAPHLVRLFASLPVMGDQVTWRLSPVTVRETEDGNKCVFAINRLVYGTPAILARITNSQKFRPDADSNRSAHRFNSDSKLCARFSRLWDR